MWWLGQVVKANMPLEKPKYFKKIKLETCAKILRKVK
jgi:hypothetical protein